LNAQHIELILYNASVVLIRKMLLDDMNTYAEHCPYGSLSPTILLIFRHACKRVQGRLLRAWCTHVERDRSIKNMVARSCSAWIIGC